MCRISVTYIVVLFVLGSSVATGQEWDEDSIVDSILARSERVFSGRFTYKLLVTRGTGDESVVTEGGDYRFDLMGDSWLLERNLTVDSKVGVITQTDTRANHKGHYVHYTKSLNGGLETRHASLEAPKPPDREEAMPPFFAGTFWRACTVEYVRDHRSDVRVVGQDEINGTAVSILELTVPASDVADAFHVVFGEMPQEGGLLRVFAAKSHMGALLRVDHASKSGSVYERFESSGFREVAEGVFFPCECTQLIFAPSGVVTLKWSYKFVDVQRVNELLADSLFVFDIPAGTTVSDLREAGRRGVILPDKAKSDDTLSKPHVTTSSSRFRFVVTSLVCLVLCAIVWGSVVTFRRRRRGSLE